MKTKSPLSGVVAMLPIYLWLWWFAGTQLKDAWAGREATAKELAVAEKKVMVNPKDAEFEAQMRDHMAYRLKLSDRSVMLAAFSLGIYLLMPVGLGLGALWWARREKLFPQNHSPSM
jgi:hypothetical protein